MRILAVDDDETILDLLAESLRVSGHGSMTKASSGRKALDIIANATEPFDCVLLDIQMPGIDGITLCATIRSIPAYARSPILMLTAMSQRDYIERAFQAGATDYITKPFDFLELGTRLSVARRLVEEQCLVAESKATIEGLKRTIKTAPRLKLPDPVEISGLERMIGYIAFENFVLSLGRGKMFTSSVTAFQLQEVNTLFERSRPTDFVARLGLVAEALSGATAADAAILSYRGNGTFLMLSQGRTAQTPEELEETVNAQLPDLTDQGMVLRLAAGQRHSLGAFTRYGAIQAVHRAVVSAGDAAGLKRAEKALNTPSTVRRLFHRSSVEPDRNPYEAMLRDVLTEEVAYLRH
ncbi:response regulator [Paragemmobacter straminiformis]|uniref:Response regulator n=1 Tax=Paragemmobacter straminiformis TaxID=2045119 RepID=A0A842I9A7_9RHOB|nr:response regulator [Gemmobacter straminiformis]MBC2835664.1 response regulator [Gemmobacter straminiformis]